MERWDDQIKLFTFEIICSVVRSFLSAAPRTVAQSCLIAPFSFTRFPWPAWTILLRAFPFHRRRTCDSRTP